VAFWLYPTLSSQFRVYAFTSAALTPSTPAQPLISDRPFPVNGRLAWVNDSSFLDIGTPAEALAQARRFITNNQHDSSRDLSRLRFHQLNTTVDLGVQPLDNHFLKQATSVLSSRRCWSLLRGDISSATVPEGNNVYGSRLIFRARPKATIIFAIVAEKGEPALFEPTEEGDTGYQVGTLARSSTLSRPQTRHS